MGPTPCVISDEYWASYEATDLRITVGGVDRVAVDIVDDASIEGPVFVLTACNPCSVDQPGWKNFWRNIRLRRQLHRRGIRTFAAFGQSLDPPWREAGYALAGTDLETARSIGRRWGQAAIFEITPEGRRVVACFEPRTSPWLRP